MNYRAPAPTVIVIGILISPLPGPGFPVLAPISADPGRNVAGGTAHPEVDRRTGLPPLLVCAGCAFDLVRLAGLCHLARVVDLVYARVLWAILVFKGHPRAGSSGSSPGDSGPARSK